MDITTNAIPAKELMELIRLQLENGGCARLPVTGYSMKPMLRHGKDAVYLRPVDPRQKKGDLILYRRNNGSFVLHRIVRVVQEGYFCSGDNQWEREFVAHSQLLAVENGFVRQGKTYAHDHPGYRIYRFLCVALFCLRRPYIGIRRFLGRCIRVSKRKLACKSGK